MPGPWAYLDDRRTHEVHLHLERAPTALVIRETAPGATADEDAYVRRLPLREPWERTVHQLAVERKLTLLGNYYRSEAGKPGWAPVRVAGARGAVDLTPTTGAQAGLEFRHFVEPARDRHLTLIGMPRDTPQGPRWVLVRVVPGWQGEDPDVKIVHSRLPPALYRSAIADLALAAVDDRMERRAPPAKDERTSWWSDVMHVVDALLATLASGRVPDDAWRPQWRGRTESARQTRERDLGQARAYEVEDEDTATAKAAAAKKATTNLDEVPSDVYTILSDGRLQTLVARFVPADEQTRLLGLGEREIREAMRKRRQQARADEQHLLSVVEAALVVRRAMKARGRLDPQTLHVLRHAPAYL